MTYHANDYDGYVADVTYEGEVRLNLMKIRKSKIFLSLSDRNRVKNSFLREPVKVENKKKLC